MSTTVNYSYDYFLRNAYSSNRFARKSENRASINSKDLIRADSDAVRKVTEKLRDLEYSSDNASEILTNVKMFIETYNNLAQSTGDSDSDSITKLKSQLSHFTKDHKDELESLGISINATGKLTLDKAKFGESSPSKIERFFGKESDFMSTVRSYALKAKRQANRLIEPAPEEPAKKENTSTEAEAELLESLLEHPETTGIFDAKS